MHKLFPYASKFLTLLSGFVALYLTARFFGPYTRGLIASSLAVVTLVATFGGLSVGRTILFEIQKEGSGALTYFKQNFISILLLVFSLMLLSILASCIWFSFFPFDVPSFILIGTFFILPYLMWSAYSSFIFSSLGKLHIQAYLICINEVLYMSTLFVCLYFLKTGIVSFIVITAIFRTISVIVELFYLYVIIEPQYLVHKRTIINVVKNGLILHLDSVGGYFIASVNVLIVNSILTKNSVGQFDLSMRLTTVMLVIPLISQIYISGDISRLGLKESWRIIHKKALYTIMVILVGIVIALALADSMVGHFFGKEYIEAAVNFKYLMPYVLFNSLCMLFNPLILSRGYFKAMSLLTILLGVINIGLGYFLISRFSLPGMIYTTNIVYMIAFAFNILFYFKIKKEVHAGS